MGPYATLSLELQLISCLCVRKSLSIFKTFGAMLPFNIEFSLNNTKLTCYPKFFNHYSRQCRLQLSC